MRIKIFLFSIVLVSALITCKEEDKEPLESIEACFNYNYEIDDTAATYVNFSNCTKNAISYQWDFGDNSFSSEENPSHYYIENGIFAVSLTAYSELDSSKTSDTVFVDWINNTSTQNIKACFEQRKWLDLFVHFFNCSENATSYLWDFGDGSFSNERNPVHFYSNNGNYLVNLTAYEGSDSNNVSEIVLVDWIDPNTSSIEACFRYETFEEGYTKFYNCSQNSTSYIWDFGDNSFSTEKNPSHYYSEDGMYIVSLTAYNELDSIQVYDTIYVEWVQVDKPNIYLYPEENIDICVSLNFPQGGEIVKSIPSYNNEWCVNIDPTGLIDDTYEFLFYESVQPDVWQYNEGWCIKKETLKDFFEANMREFNFSEKEIGDFIEHWIPILTEYDYYEIYPQYNEVIEEVIQLGFSTEPDNVFRLFYGVVGVSEYKELKKPEAIKITRDGFYVVEWGVFIK